MWSKDVRNFMDQNRDSLVKGHVKTGFAENMEASFDNEVASGLSISRYLMNAPVRDRNALMRDKARKDPALMQFMTMQTGESGYPEKNWDYDGMADYLVEQGDEEIQPLGDIQDQIRMSVKQADGYQQFVSSNQDGWGMAGEFTGVMGAQAADPVNLVSVIPGLGQASLTAKIAGGAVVGATQSMMQQPSIQSWKNENDIEYTDSDAAVDVGFSALFGAGGAAMAEGLGRMIGRLTGRNADPKISMDEREANDAALMRLTDARDEVTSLDLDPDPDLTIGQKLRTLDERAARIMEGTDEPNTVSEPAHNKVDDVPDEQAALEEGLGITREKPEVPEGVDVDTVKEQVMFDPEKFKFKVDGEDAASIVKHTDDEIDRMQKTIECMMGGNDA